MMNNYESTICFESHVMPGVLLTLRKLSFAGRVQLLESMRGLVSRVEYARAGSSADEATAAVLLEAEAERLLVKSGLVSIEGLAIDGGPANVESLLERGPEPLVHEVAERFQRECILTEDERKN